MKKKDLKKRLLKLAKKTLRDLLKKEGLLNIHKGKVFKSKKNYTRKNKHKNKNDS